MSEEHDSLTADTHLALPRVEALYAEVLGAGGNLQRIRELLQQNAPEESVLRVLLRRPVAVPFLEHLGTRPPWSDRPGVLGAVALNPRVPRALALRLAASLYWRDLALLASTLRVDAAVRARAESILQERLPELRLGERIALARVATGGVLRSLLADLDPKVLEAALLNPRLREDEVVTAVRRDSVAQPLLESVAQSTRWQGSYAVRLSLVLQPRTPLALALGRIRTLVKGDLLQVAASTGLRPVVQAAALRVAAEQTS
jgi:hypothetical protein